MKIALLLLLSVLCVVINAAPAPQCFPTLVTGMGNAFVGYGQVGYKYSLPNLNVQKAATYNIRDVALCSPGSFVDAAEDYLVFGNGAQNPASVNIKASDLSVLVKSANPAPFPPQNWPNYAACTPLTAGTKYCFENQQVVKRTGATESTNGQIAESVSVGGGIGNYIAIDSTNNHLYVATSQSSGYRGTSNYTLTVFSLNPLAVLYTGAELPWTASYGCPVPANDCGVPVLLSFTVTDDIAVWLWSNAASGAFVVTIQSYDARCKKGYSTTLDGRDSGDYSPRCTGGNTCTGSSCGQPEPEGQCSAQACCDAKASPNYQTGAGFYKYNASCKQGGQHCVGNTGCQLCFRGTSAQANEGNRPACGF